MFRYKQFSPIKEFGVGGIHRVSQGIDPTLLEVTERNISRNSELKKMS
jgi:hypothetical protein